VVLANPPFAGSLEYENTAKDLQQVVKTKKTELLFSALFLRLLKPGGRAAVIVPDGVLFGSTKAHKELRRILVEDQRLDGIVSLPSGVSRPYAGVVLDTGAVEGLAPLDEERRARLRLLREEARDLVVPAAVLAEGLLTGNVGHDYHVRRLLDVVNIVDVEVPIGHAAGALRQAAIRGGLDPAPTGVDAIIAAEADERAAGEDVRIVTSDGDDFEVLASLATNAARLSLLVV